MKQPTLTLLFTALLAGASSSGQVTLFRPSDKSIVPRNVIDQLCDPKLSDECWSSFEGTGTVWRGDVNGDGVDEILIAPGSGWCGSGGCSYYLYRVDGRAWTRLNGEQWFVYRGRFGILPVVREGYNDIRIAVDLCVKWNRRRYVEYEPQDYHRLTAKLFDESNLDEAEIFWAIRYSGLKRIRFEPQWFPTTAEWSRLYEGGGRPQLEDPTNNLLWIALYKGGVWAVKGKQAFLLLPRPAYKGAERLEFQGDWLVVYAEVGSKIGLHPVARYNRRTGELCIHRWEPEH